VCTYLCASALLRLLLQQQHLLLVLCVTIVNHYGQQQRSLMAFTAGMDAYKRWSVSSPAPP